MQHKSKQETSCLLVVSFQGSLKPLRRRMLLFLKLVNCPSLDSCATCLAAFPLGWLCKGYQGTEGVWMNSVQDRHF